MIVVKFSNRKVVRMYKAIYEYAVNHGLSLPKYRKEKQIKGYIKLTADGDYEGFEKIPKEAVTRVWCPHITDTKPTIICEKLQYIFPEKDASSSVNVKHNGWMDIMKEGAQYAKTLQTIHLFLAKAEIEEVFRDDIRTDIVNAGIKNGDFISFRLDSINAENEEDWTEWFNQYAEAAAPKSTNEKNAVSELTGHQIVPITEKFPQNTSKAAGTGFPIYSNQHRKVSGEACSFVSYGCVNGIACPMSSEEADAVNAGLKLLLDSDINNDRDFGFVYWYDRNDATDLITKARALRRRSSTKGVDEIEKEREAQYKNVLNAVFEGAQAEQLEDKGKYHIVEYNLPDKGRVSLSKEYLGTYGELYGALQQWYADSTYSDIIWLNNQNLGVAIFTIGNICSVLFQCLRHKNVTDLQKEADIEYGADKRNLIKAMLFGKKIPRIYLQNASEQLTRHYICNKQFKDEKRSRRILLQIIKACLLREGYKDMDVTLNKDAASIGYQCGRWFALIVRCQELAAGKKLNVTIAERYYRAAKQSPARTFAMINDMKEHYLSKLSAGSRISMEQLFAEIAGHIGFTFPERFTILEQGAFDLGYAQQRQSFFERAEDKIDKDSGTDKA